MEAQQFDLFMSHKKQDVHQVRQIATRLLDEYSIRSWLDEWDLSAGEDWEKEIEKVLNTCAACAIFLGSNGWGNHHLKEAKFVLGRMVQHPDFLALPVLLPGARQQDMNLLGDFFNKRHRVDFSNGVDDEAAFQVLRAAIRREAQGPPTMTEFTIRRDAERWNRAPGNDKSLLYRGYELREAQRIAAQFTKNLNELAFKFLAESASEEQRGIQAERRRNRIIITTLTILLVAFISSTVYAFRKRSEAEEQTRIANEQRKNAEEQTRIAEQRRLAEEVQRGIAVKQTNLAEERRKDAEKERDRAEEQTAIANEQRNIAKRQTVIAEERRQDAQRQKDIAEARKAEAESERNIATQQRDTALRLLYTGQMRLAEEASGRNDTDRVLEILDDLRPKPGEIDLRSFDWFYYWRLYHSHLLTLPQTYSRERIIPGEKSGFRVDFLRYLYKGKVLAVLIKSPDGTEGELKLWDLSGETPKEQKNMALYSATALDFLEQQKLIAVAHIYIDEKSRESAAGVRLINIDTGEHRILFQGYKSWISDIAFSPDGKTLGTCSRDKTVRLWDVATGQELKKLEGHTDEVDKLTFSPDGRLLASGGKDHFVRLWDLDKGQELAKLDKHSDQVTALAFSPDGKILASGGADMNIYLWDVATRKPITHKPMLHTSWVMTLTFTPKGDQLASAGGGGDIYIWNAASGQKEDTIRGHQAGVNSIAFSPDGETLASGDSDGILKIWNGQNKLDQLVSKVDQDTYGGMAFSADGKIVASSRSGVVQLWDVATGELLHTLRPTYGGETQSVAFSPDGRFLATGSKSSIVNDRLQSSIILWDLQTWSPHATLSGHVQYVGALAFSYDGKTLASASLDALKLWDVTSGRELKTLCQESVGWSDLRGCGVDQSLAFSLNGKMLASAGMYGPVVLWDIELGTKKILVGRIIAVDPRIAFSPDGQLLAAESDDRSIVLWNVQSGKPQIRLGGSRQSLWATGESSVWSVTFSNDGKLLATGMSNRTVKLWNVATGQELLTLHGRDHTSSRQDGGDERLVSFLAFTPDNETLLAGSRDGTLNRWTGASRREVYDLTTRTAPTDKNGGVRRQLNLVISYWERYLENREKHNLEEARRALNEGVTLLQSLNRSGGLEKEQQDWIKAFLDARSELSTIESSNQRGGPRNERP